MTISPLQRSISFAVTCDAYDRITAAAAHEGLAVGALVRDLVLAAFAPDLPRSIKGRVKNKQRQAPEPLSNTTALIRRETEPVQHMPQPGDEPISGAMLSDADIKALLLKGRSVAYICGRWRVPYKHVQDLRDRNRDKPKV